MRFLYGLLLLLFSVVAAAETAGEVQITEPFARAAMAHQKNSAVFMGIMNQGADSAVVAASSPVAEVVELHTHTMDNGVMRMRRIERIDLPSGEQVMLKPGGLHVMLIGLKQALEADSEISVTLEYADGSEQNLTVPVVNVMRAQGHGSDHGMSHEQGHGMKHEKAEGMGNKKCHGKGHGEGYEKAEGKKHGKCHGEGHGKDYEHGKGYKQDEGYEHGECHGKHRGKGHDKEHGKGDGEAYKHGEGYEHGECHGKHHGEGHEKGQMNDD